MSGAKNDACSIICEAEKEGVLVTRHGKLAGVVIGFRDEDNWFDYGIEHDEKFFQRIAKAGGGTRKEEHVTLDELSNRMLT